MPSKRDVLEQLKPEELRAALDRVGLDVRDRRSKAGLVEALASSRKASLAEVLSPLLRKRLQEICSSLNLETSGREKAVLIARLTGQTSSAQASGSGAASVAIAPEVPAAPVAATPASPPARGSASKKSRKAASSANLGFEDKLWAAADKLRGHMDASEYKNVVLGLIFLKYISDSFEELHAKLEKDPESDPEERDEYLAESIFWV